jgi:hypothetical protein
MTEPQSFVDSPICSPVTQHLGSIRTFNSAPTTILSIPLAPDSAATFLLCVTAHDSTNAYRASYGKAVSVYRTGSGTVAIQGVGNFFPVMESHSGLNVDFTCSGDSLVCQVIGINSVEMFWSCFGICQVLTK